MKKITIYQKPTCSKCRETLRILRERGVEFDAINYYEAPLTAKELSELLQKLGMTAREILRKDEPIGRELGVWKNDIAEDELIALMVKNPDLMQRPDRGARG